jgi:hypothetical protein
MAQTAMRFELGVLRKAQNSGSNCLAEAIAQPLCGLSLEFCAKRKTPEAIASQRQLLNRYAV